MPRHETELKPIGPHPDTPIGDIVFIHGLGGGWRKTWRSRKTGWSWPQWVAEQNPALAVWSLDYDNPMFGFGVRPLDEHARSALDRFRSVGARPKVLVGHSMGGLMAKSLFVEGESDESLRKITDSVRGVVFLGTPHFGSNWASLFGWLGSRSFRENRRNGAALQALHDGFVAVASRTQTSIRNYKEERRVGPGKIVPDTSADPRFQGVVCVGLAGNHGEIVKPQGPDAPIVRSLGAFIAETFIEAALMASVEAKVLPVSSLNPFVDLRETTNRHTATYGAVGALPPHIPHSQIDSRIAESLSRHRAALLIGPSKSGKTHCAFRALRESYPDHRLLSPAPGRVHELLAAVSDLPNCVLWLDDVERYAADSALTVAAIRDFLDAGDSRLVVATIRSRVAARFVTVERSEESYEIERLVAWLPDVPIEGDIEAAEANRLYPDVDHTIGIGAAFVAIDQMYERVTTSSSGQRALVTLIADCQRLNLGSLGAALIEEFYAIYARRESHTAQTTADAFNVAMRWALAEIVPDVALVMNRGVHADDLYLLDGVVDYVVDGRSIDRALVARAIETNPDLADMGYSAWSSGDELAARQIWAAGVEQGDDRSANALGVRLLRDQAYAEAISVLQIASERGNIDAAANLGIAHWNLGDTESAEEAWARAADGGQPMAIYNIGSRRLDRGDEAGATEMYVKASASGHVKALSELGRMAHAQGELAAAEGHWSAALRNGYTKVARNLALVRNELGDVSGAIEAHRVAVSEGDVGSMNSLGVLLHSQGELDEAIELFEIGAAHGDSDAAFNLGLCLDEAGLADLVEGAYQRAVELGVADAATNLSVLCKARGDSKAAERWLQKAAQLRAGEG